MSLITPRTSSRLITRLVLAESIIRKTIGPPDSGGGYWPLQPEEYTEDEKALIDQIISQRGW